MKPALKILILEDSIIDADLIQRLLKKEKIHFECSVAMDKESFEKAFDEFSPDVILSDNSLPQFNAAEALKIVRQRSLEIPFILVTGTVSEEFAANIIKSGADDYILKDRMARLPTAINAAIQYRHVQKEKQEAQEELVQSAAKYRALFERNLAGVYQITMEGHILNCNDAFANMLGYASCEELKSINAFSLYFSASERKEFIADLENKGKITNHDSVMKHKTGSLVNVLENISFLTDTVARQVIVEGVMLDITERMRVEEELRQEQYLMQTLMKNLPDHIYFKDKESRFFRISNSQSQVFGLTDPIEAVGKTDFDFFSKDYAIRTFKDEETIRLTGVTISKEEAETRPGMPVRYVSTTKMPLKNEAGDTIGTFGISRDITERKNAELQKEFDSNNLEALINNTNDLMWSVDKDLKLITFNDSFRRIIKLTSGRSLVKGDDILSTQFTEDQLKRYQEFYQRALIGEVFTIIDHFEHPVEFWAEVSFYPIYNGDVLMGTACFSHDITARKKSEGTLKNMAQEMLNQQVQEQKKITRAIINAEERERNRIGQELHDNINQILAVTKLYLSMAGKEDSKVKELIAYPLKLIDNSISEIRLLSSKQVTPLQDINLKEMVQALLDRLSESTTIKTTFVYNVTNGAIADDLKLNIYRIIQEQVNNIVKHAASKNITVSVQASGRNIHINVTDDGKGFNTTSKRKGIGISNMLNRIKSFDGDMAIESSPGNGCAIQIKIPY